MCRFNKIQKTQQWKQTRRIEVPHSREKIYEQSYSFKLRHISTYHRSSHKYHSFRSIQSSRPSLSLLFLFFLRRNLPSSASLLTFFIGLLPSKHSEKQPGTSLHCCLHFCASNMNVNIIFIFTSLSSSSLSFVSSFFTLRYTSDKKTFVSWVTSLDIRMER